MDLRHQKQTGGVSYYAAVLKLDTAQWFWVANYSSIADIKQALGKQYDLAIADVNEEFKIFEMGEKQKIDRSKISQKYREAFGNEPIEIEQHLGTRTTDKTTRRRCVRLSDDDHAKLLKLGGSRWLRKILNEVEV